MSTLTVFILIATCSVLAVAVKKLDVPQKADGSPVFNYFSDEAKSTADQLTKILLDLDDALEDYLYKLETRNSALDLLKSYYRTAVSAEGTNCAVTKENKERLRGNQQDIEKIVETCAAFAPVADREALKKAITESLIKTQDTDNTLRTNAAICFSLRVPPSKSCQDSKKKALKRLKDIVSTKESAKFSNLARNAFINTKKAIDTCVKKGTSYIKLELESRAKVVKDCKSSLKKN